MQRRFDNKVEECQAFYAEHGRGPSTVGRTESERALAQWIVMQRHPYSKISDREQSRRHTLLDERCPWWRPRDFAGLWWQRLRELETFITAHGRFPERDRTASGDAAENVLARWLESQRAAANGLSLRRRWDAERAAALNAGAPGWLTGETCSSDPSASASDAA